MKCYCQHGFTLLEMLVALTVFALLSAMVYGGQMAVLNAKQATDRQAEKLKQLQRAMLMFERDISQHLLRPVRDDYGDSQPPMVSADYGDIRLSLTRAGWQNPLNLPRSTLQRVGYGIEDEKLLRYSWPMLDRAQGSEPYKMVLLESVRDLKLRYLGRDREWQDQWPPHPSGNEPLVVMPLAVEMTLELEDWGTFRRIVSTPGGGVDMQAVPETEKEL
ncbi:MAG: type II secretion system minor pseudopilin GspJ [Pseudomonadota bacterium]